MRWFSFLCSLLLVPSIIARPQPKVVDEGKLDWDDPVTDHLPGFQLSDPFVRDERVTG